MKFLIGAYDTTDISEWKVEESSNSLVFVRKFHSGPNPTWISRSASIKDVIYAVNEVDEYEGKKTGAIASFKYNPCTFNWEISSKLSSEETGPCHVHVDSNGGFIYVSNYW